MFAPGHLYFRKNSKKFVIVLYMKSILEKKAFSPSLIFFDFTTTPKIYKHFTGWTTYENYGKII